MISENQAKLIFNALLGKEPNHSEQILPFLKASLLDTPLGPMIAISDDDGLYLLEFTDRPAVIREVEQLRLKKKAAIVPGENQIISLIKKELALYFSGRLTEFQTPLHPIGSPFQKKVWQALIKIPYGETKSYKQQAEAIGNKKAFRAVANANGANPLAIIIPCHRIINSNGQLGGYGGGLQRKKWLIDHEKNSTHKEPAT